MPGRLRDGALAALPLAPGPLLFGASFGVLAADAGLNSVATVLMSATTFAGSAQFAAASVLETGGGAIAAIVVAVLLNARYVPLSVSVASIFPGSRRRRLVESQLIVDESWAVAQVGHGRINRRVLVGAGLVLFPFWVGGTALGVLFGDVLGDPERFGLDAAFPALFLALLATQLVNRRTVLAAVAGGVIAFVLIPVAPPGVPVIAASAVCLLGLMRR